MRYIEYYSLFKIYLKLLKKTIKIEIILECKIYFIQIIMLKITMRAM